MSPRLALLSLVSFVVGCANDAERSLYTAGHADISLELIADTSGPTFDAYLSAHDALVDGERITGAVSLEDVVIRSRARFVRPNGDSGAFEALCVPSGTEIAWLPQGLRAANDFESPFLGIAAIAEPDALFGETVALRLLRVDSPSGSGHYALWRDAFPPEFFMSSCDGIDSNDVLSAPRGHDHYNMGFTETGEWTLTYEVSAALISGETASSELRVHYVLE